MDPGALQKAGGANLTQAITSIRDMFVDAVGCGTLALDEVKALSDRCLVAEPANLEGLDARATMRVLVENVRGAGYRLRLPPDAVVRLR